MTKITAALVPLAIILAFIAGAFVQDQRVRDHYKREGRISAFYDMQTDGYMVYLLCLSDHCEKQKFASDYMVAQAKKYLQREGVEEDK